MGTTPLFMAAQTGNIEIVKCLLEENARLDMSITASTRILLNFAKIHHREQQVSRLLKKHLKEIPNFLSNFTPLHSAIFSGNTEMVSLLLKAHADINKKTEGISCRELAEAMGNTKIISLLEQHQLDLEKNSSLRFR